MSDGISETIGSASKQAKIWGVVTLILGVIAIAIPFVAGLAVATVFGILLILAGGAQTLYAFQADSFGRGLLRLLFGGITLVGGIAVIAAPATGLAALTLVLAAYFLVDGMFAVVAGIQLKPAPGWGWMVFNGVITVLLAWMIWAQWPISGAWAVGILIGVRLLLTGITMISLGSAGRSFAKEAERIGG